MPINPLLSGAIHDLQARLGSIRMAVTAVHGLELDDQTRDEMLTSASDESVRASAELAGVGALAGCLLDASPPVECDVAEALHAAADTARIAGLDVDVVVKAEPLVVLSRARLSAALPALLRIVGGAGKTVTVAITADGVALAGEDPEPVPQLAHSLADQLGPLVFTFGGNP